ncbi:MAG: zinc ABC transporter substrate-binding protein [Aurantimonas endophytica]|uniref:zinc ABC transporter substrate-binding protein n=1 Tax=Aurantimonas endophytica TaxID=1522175 RepID=UPI003001568E
MVRRLALSASLLLATAGIANAAPNVVVSIKPLHSLVAAVMEGVSEPSLIVTGAGSPHNYALKPSQAAALEEADLIFWMGHELETFLERPVETIGTGATVVSLIDAPGLKLLPFREGGAFEAHDHAHEGHAAEAAGGHDHAHEEAAGETHDHTHEAEAGGEHHDHAHEAAAGHSHDDDHGASASEATHDHAHEEPAAGHDHAHEEAAAGAGHNHDHSHGASEGGHDHGDFDPHVWLDPQNAKALAAAIGSALAAADPENAEHYAANTATLDQRLDALTAEVEAQLEPVKDRGFIVFHDAYHYFEDRFGLEAAGSITINPETPPGAERVTEIQARVRELGATCVFAEPQFEPRIISVVTEGTEARTGELDPLGAAIADGPELYFELIETMAASMRECLADPS